MLIISRFYVNTSLTSLVGLVWFADMLIFRLELFRSLCFLLFILILLVMISRDDIYMVLFDPSAAQSARLLSSIRHVPFFLAPSSFPSTFSLILCLSVFTCASSIHLHPDCPDLVRGIYLALANLRGPPGLATSMTPLPTLINLSVRSENSAKIGSKFSRVSFAPLTPSQRLHFGLTPSRREQWSRSGS